MQQDVSGNDRDAGSAWSPSSSHSGVAKLPDHFAATFEYTGEGSATPSRTSSSSAPDLTKGPISQQSAPRRSPRKSRARLVDLSAAFAESEDEEGDARQRLGGSSPSKRKNGLAKSPRVLYGEALPCGSSVNIAKVRKRIKRTRDDPNSPAGSIYAHLKGLPDLFAERNDIMFCGINPGVKSSHSGHHFAHRSNHFYPSLHLAGITSQRMKPEQDVDFPFLRPFSLGLTNLAGRPTAEGSELLPSELIAGVPILLEKIQRWKPRTVCFVGKGISEAFLKGLKQAGAIYNESNGRRKRKAEAASPRKKQTVAVQQIKLEETDQSCDSGELKTEGSEEKVRTLVSASIPESVLCAFSPPVSATEDVQLKQGNPPSPKKQLYTKGNSKDDTGYGVLPICVPHTKQRGDRLGLENVTLFFVTPSSSARVTTHFLDDKARILSSLRLLSEHVQSTPPVRHEGMVHERGNAGVKLEEDASLASGASEIPVVNAQTKIVQLEVVEVSRFQNLTDDDDPFGDGITVDL